MLLNSLHRGLAVLKFQSHNSESGIPDWKLLKQIAMLFGESQTHGRQKNRMMKNSIVLVFCAFLVGGCAMSQRVVPERFVQDQFAIGFWVDPPLDNRASERYREIAEANFTTVIGGFGATTPEAVKKQLDLCQKNHLKALVSLPGYRQGAQYGASALEAVRESDKFPDHPACWGFLTKDEPVASEFADLAFITAHLRKTRPGRLTYINLFPNYANMAQLGAPNYDEHVRRFVAEVTPDVLSMDHYPMMSPHGDGRSGYCENLQSMRDSSLQAGIPFWNFFNTMPFGPHYDPTEAQLRWQIYTSLAYGAKGILYFCYQTPPPGVEFPRGGAIITVEGRRTRHYEQAKRINACLKNMGDTLMKLTSTGVYRVPRQSNSRQILSDTPIRAITDGDYLIGTFRHEDGRRAILINNYDFSYTEWPTVTFDVPDDKVMEIDQQTGKEVPAIDDSPAVPGLQLSLDSGAGRLFLLPPR